MEILTALALIRKNGNQFAAAYAGRAILDWDMMDRNAKHTQLLYVLSNISGLRKPNRETARLIKQTIRDMIKELGS